MDVPNHKVTELWHPRDAPRGWLGLEVIAVFKMVKAAGLIIAGLGALGLLNSGRADLAESWLEQLSLSEGHRLAAKLAGKGLLLLQNATPRQIIVAALGSFLYAAIFLVEGIGLWRCKRWAEFLTVIVTASLLPVEAIALTRHPTWIRGGAVVVNLVVVAYLIWQINISKPHHRLPAEPAAQ